MQLYAILSPLSTNDAAVSVSLQNLPLLLSRKILYACRRFSFRIVTVNSLLNLYENAFLV
jgi:hypothetical protein